MVTERLAGKRRDSYGKLSGNLDSSQAQASRTSVQLELADLLEGMHVLEPEASWAKLTQAANRVGPDDSSTARSRCSTSRCGMPRRRQSISRCIGSLAGVATGYRLTRYLDHRHPPEEIYVVLSDGQWRQAGDPWHEPRIGGLVYNPPNFVHAMRSGERPLLALWFLWTGPYNS
jgi:hypothetical protein